jgi:DNA-binding transcriptional LysR family regulator
MYTLSQLRYLVALADALHFGRAARLLGMTQPALSQQIRRLEAEVGVSLLVRDRRNVALTAAGEALVTQARRALAEADRGVMEARRIAQGGAIDVTLGFIGPAALSIVPAALAHMNRCQDAPRITLVELDTPQLMARLAGRSIDLAILRGPLTDRRFHIATLCYESLHVALPRSHPLARRRAIRCADLAEESLVLFPHRRASGMYDAIMAAFHASAVEPRVGWEVSDWPAILSFVANGLGISVVPHSVTLLHRDGCVYRPLADVAQRAELALGWPDHPMSAAVRTVHSALVAVATSA